MDTGKNPAGIKEARFLPSFYLTVNSVFILLILAVGGVLTWHNFTVTRQIVFAGAEKTYDQASREVAADFVKTYRPVFHTVTLLSLSEIAGAVTLEERLASLEMFRAALRSQAELAALQVGYEDGGYFIVRPLRSTAVRERFGAPREAAFVVDNIPGGPDGGKRYLARLYFDDRLREVGRLAPEETEYDPRLRPWYRQALKSDTALTTDPYYFFFIGEVGTTVSYRSPGSQAVLGADVTLGQMSETVGMHVMTPRSEVAIIDREGSVWAYQNHEKVVIEVDDGQFRMANLAEVGSDVLTSVGTHVKIEPGPLEFRHGGEPWQGFIRPINASGKSDRGGLLLMVSPRRELLADAIRMVKRSLLVTLVIVLLSLPLASMIAAAISRALHRLAGEADRISRFDFDSPITVQSRIKEMNNLARSMDLMKTTIGRFLSLIRSLASEQNFDAMLELITEEIVEVSGVDGAMTWLFDEEKNTLDPGALFEQDREHIDLKKLPGLSLGADHELFKSVSGKELRTVRLLRGPETGLDALFETFDTDSLLATAMPLLNRQEETIGLLCLLKKSPGKKEQEGEEGRIDFVKTFSGFAAVSLESRQLLEMQKRLMDSFMHLLAGAIDAKSAYTGGHCQRVPIITKMIARAACDDNSLYKDYQLDDKAWEAIHLASWLHDCGKVTTPEYVVDKATKLETIYDRIHELRTRFEVLKRDAEIRYWEKVSDGGDRAGRRTVLEQEWRDLDDDFAFVAACNLGDDPMTTERVERLEEIAGRRWKRTLDDRLGISWEEGNRKAKVPQPELPVEEPLIADRPDHLIERMKREKIKPDNPWGFKLDVPEFLYNRGELYNLKVARGTLNDEERFKINDHIVQTIKMLSKLPYPRHLRKTPEIAGGHHEKMDGRGYPKRLTGDEMSITARMMAIADIFEALTASDRPYKKAKKLSESIRIMGFMKKDGHIDPGLFELFLRSGVPLEYGRKYLHPDQVDEVDIEASLS